MFAVHRLFLSAATDVVSERNGKINSHSFIVILSKLPLKDVYTKYGDLTDDLRSVNVHPNEKTSFFLPISVFQLKIVRNQE